MPLQVLPGQVMTGESEPTTASGRQQNQEALQRLRVRAEAQAHLCALCWHVCMLASA